MALTTDTVADAAMRILSDFGLGDLTMRRLARDLGVQPSALYWHVADKQSLFVLLAARMSAEADATTDDTIDAGAEAVGPGAIDAESPTAAGSLTRTVHALAAYRGILLKYRESADIVLLAYAHSGPSVLPSALARLDMTRRELLTAFILGSITVQQNRSLFGTHEEGPSDDAEALFRAGIMRLLSL